MSSPKITDVNQACTMLRIIIGSLVVGVVSFGSFVIWSWLNAGVRPDNSKVISILAVIATTSVFFARSIIPSLVTSAGVKRIGRQAKHGSERTADFLELFNTKSIIEGALLDAGAFFVLIAFMLEHQLWVLGLLVPLLGALLLSFPSPDEIENWIETQEQNLSFEETE